MLTIILYLALIHALVPSELPASYYQGDGTAVNWYLDLRADSSFEFRWEGCLGAYDHQAGRWSVFKGTVQLATVTRQQESIPNSVSTHLRPVRWGQRVYLVPTEALVDFANLVNEGIEPRTEAYGQAFLRDGDWTKPVSGKPDLPPEIESFLLVAPIRAHAVVTRGRTTVTINRGSNDGIKVGMHFHFQGNDLLSYRVISTLPKSCRAETIFGDTARVGPVSTLLYDPTLHRGVQK